MADLFYDDPTGGPIHWLRADPGNEELVEQDAGLTLPAPLFAQGIPPKPLYADLDGDGVLDQIQCHDLPLAPSDATIRGSWEIRRWTPSGFGAAEPITIFGDRSCMLQQYLQVVDIDRDGKAEMLIPSFGYLKVESPGALGPSCGGLCTYTAVGWERAPDGSTLWTMRDTHLPAPNWGAGPGRVIFADVNGDGLTDAVEASNLAGLVTHLLFTFLNTGDGFDPVGVLAVPDGPASQDDYLGNAAPIDYDGDGQMDLLLPMKDVACPDGEESSWVVLKAGAEGIGQFTIVPTSIDADDSGGDDPHPVYGSSARFLPRISDVDGDGRQDVMLATGGTFKLYHNEGPRDLLAAVTDGMSPLDPGEPGFVPSVAITYGNLVDHARAAGIDPASEQAESETYLPRFDPANGCAYPRVCVVGPRRVVAAYTLNNGQNQERHFSLQYRDGRAHRLGRGFLGFGAVITRDEESGTGTLNRYDNVTSQTPETAAEAYPFAHQVIARASWAPDLEGAPFLLTAIDLVDRDLRTMSSTGEANFFPYSFLVHSRKQEADQPLGGFGPAQTLLDLVEEQAALPDGNLLDTVDSFGFPDAFGNVLGETHTTLNVDDARGVARTIVNDEAHWLLGQVTDETACSAALGAVLCRHAARTYDDRGEIATEAHEDPAHPETQVAITLVRDAFGNVTRATADDTFGHHRSACVSFDGEGLFPYAVGNPAGHLGYLAFDSALGVQTAQRDPNGLTTSWTHDAFGRTTRELRPDQTSTDFSLTRVKDGGPPGASWWALHARTQISFGGDLSTTFDGLGRPVKKSARGPQVTSCSDLGCAIDPVYEEDITYDVLGRVAARTRPFRTSDPPGAHPSTTYRYDVLGRVLTETSPWGAVTSYSYQGNTVLATMPGSSSFIEQDAWGRPVRVTDALGGQTSYTYGPFGALRTIQMPGGHALTTTKDAYGHALVETDPDRGTTTMEYDGFGQLRTSTDALGRTTHLTHDALGRLTLRQDADGVVLFHYDDPLKGKGRLSEVLSPDGLVESYTYDGIGRPKTSTLTVGGESFTTKLEYNPQGHLSTIEYPQGTGGAFVVKNEYDARGNLVTVRNNQNQAPYWQLLEVDGEGRPSFEHFGDGTDTRRERFADKGTLKHLLTTKGGAKLQDLSYTYDARLNLTARIDALQQGVGGALGERFTYDALDRLTCSRFDASCVPGVNCTCNQLVSYQPDGNIASKSDVGTYTYDPAHPHAVAQAGAGSYGHDAVGNQVDRPEQTVAYTAFDLPKTYTNKANGGVTSFGYDSGGTRIRKTTPSSQITYVGDYERTAYLGSPLKQYRYAVRAGGRVVAVVARANWLQGNAITYLHADHLGSTDVVTDDTGKVVERRSYDAFGAKRNPAWGQALPGAFTAKTSYGFTGDEAEDDLVNMRGRIYDAKLGRFLMTDPVVSDPLFSQRWNPYSYVLNNPLRWVDPSGFDNYLLSTNDINLPLDQLIASPQFGVANVLNGGVGVETTVGPPAAGDSPVDHDAGMPAGEFVPPVPTGASGQQFQDSVPILPFFIPVPMQYVRPYQTPPSGAPAGLAALRQLNGQPAVGVANFSREIAPGTSVPNLTLQLVGVIFDAVSIVGAVGRLGPAAAEILVVADAAKGGELSDDAVSAAVPVGRRGQQITFPNPSAPRPRNAPARLLGREFSGHALDRMQERGFTPSVVQNAIEHGVPKPQVERGTILYWDSVNKFNVSVDATNGRVVTVF